jgi:ribosomal-protein-alanine N-acetyltransferase
MNSDIDSIFLEQPVLQTKRLVLRPIVPSDAQAIFDMRTNNRVNEFIARSPMMDLVQAEELIKRVDAQFKLKKCLSFAGVLRGEGVIIGTCGFNQFDFPNRHAEIGGEMDQHYWGKGIAQEAFESIVKFGFQKLDLQTIEAKVLPSNRSAVALLERYGFEKEAHFRNRILFEQKFIDLVVYTLHRDSALKLLY